jgi:hypothetical protein
MICKIADFVVEFVNVSPALARRFEPYVCDETPMVSFSITSDDIKHVRTLTKNVMDNFLAESTTFLDKFVRWLPQNNAIYFHASLIEAENQGIAFTALSGTGKSTHTVLWQQLLGDKMRIVNGDKPIIRIFEDGSIYAYGTPWNGKEGYGTNDKTPLKHICFIERCTHNSCVKISTDQALKKIFNQILIPNDPISATYTLSVLDKILKAVTVWNIKCNMDISAAKTAYNAIFKGESNET